jgi:tetratricopeptide (TPR) repeat protein
MLPLVHSNLGSALLKQHDAAGAVRHFEAACELLAPGAADRTMKSVIPRLQYALALEKLGEAQFEAGDRAGARAELREALQIAEEIERSLPADDALHLRSRIAPLAQLARKLLHSRDSKRPAKKRSR